MAATVEKNMRTPDEQKWIHQVQRRNRTLANRHPDAAQLFKTLRQIGGDGTILFHVNDEPDLEILLSRGEHVSRQGRTRLRGARCQCHRNVSTLYAAGKITHIMTGYALAQDGAWRQHTWGVKKNAIVETTNDYLAYFGVRLSPAESKAFATAEGASH